MVKENSIKLTMTPEMFRHLIIFLDLKTEFSIDFSQVVKYYHMAERNSIKLRTTSEMLLYLSFAMDCIRCDQKNPLGLLYFYDYFALRKAVNYWGFLVVESPVQVESPVHGYVFGVSPLGAALLHQACSRLAECTFPCRLDIRLCRFSQSGE